MMSEAETSNDFVQEDQTLATSNKFLTPNEQQTTIKGEGQTSAGSANDQIETRTMVCSNTEMARIVAKVELLKSWTMLKFRTSKQSVLEQFGKVEKTVDLEIDGKISYLHDLHNRYREVLNAATAYSTHFNALNNAKRFLAESFYQLSLRELDLKKALNDQNETLRQFTQHADEFSKQLTYFVSSLETLCNKTIKDTLLTVQHYESARLEFDAHRHELSMLQQNPVGMRKQTEDLQAKCDLLKQRYDQLKEDVRVKLALLDENRLKVMRAQIVQFEKGLHQYLTEGIKAVDQNSPRVYDNDSNFDRGVVVRGSTSFLEQ